MSILHQHHDVNAAGPLHDTGTVSKDVFAEVLEAYCPRIKAMMHTERAARFARLVEAGAWTDAALALLALELPQWQIRRLAYDDGEWHCALSDNREMPDWLDASIEMHHADMALAILSTVIEARSQRQLSQMVMGPAATDSSFEPMCCDNFA